MSFFWDTMYVHHVEDPGGGEAGHEDPDEEAEEEYDGAECLTPAQLYSTSKFCLSQVFRDKNNSFFSRRADSGQTPSH